MQGKRKNSELEKLIGTFGPSDPEFTSVAEEIAAIEGNAVFMAGPGGRVR
jgi:hypothetical protein